jgi:hypothetical protein
MSEPQLASLRRAAETLLTAAPPSAVLAALRALVADWDLEQPAAALPAPPRAAGHVNGKETAVAAPTPTPATGPAARPIPTKVQPAGPKADTEEAAAWERLRLQVREVRQVRSVTVQALANELGFTYSTLGTALQTRAVPSLRLRQLLTNWVNPAPEVASAPVATFPANGAGHAGNDAGKGAEAR